MTRIQGNNALHSTTDFNQSAFIRQYCEQLIVFTDNNTKNYQKKWVG